MSKHPPKRDHKNRLIQAAIDAIRPEMDLMVSDWADAFRMLPQKSSSEHGRYKTDRTPYLREIQEALSVASVVQEICVMKGTQLGFTEVGNNWFLYSVDISPGPFLMIFPTDKLARDHSRQKLTPTIDETPRIRKLIRSEKSRQTGNTILEKDFKGGVLWLCGSNSPSNYRSKTVRFLFLDDVDGYEGDVGGEGDPCDLAKKRTDTYSYRKKIYEVSTPTNKGRSRIESSFDESDQRFYHVPCPHCGILQRLEWGGPDVNYGIKFDRDKSGAVILAWYQCRHCLQGIDESHKAAMLAGGRWIPTYPDRKKRGYHLSSLYSPPGWVSWLQVCQEFISAAKKPKKMKVWRNTRLGLPFHERIKERDISTIQALKDDRPRGRLPGGGVVAALLAAVDTQDNGFWYRIRAFGFGGPDLLKESWGVREGFVTSWKALEQVLWKDRYTDPEGNEYQVQMALQDALGHRTAEVYRFCVKHRGRIYPTFGKRWMSTSHAWTNLSFYPGTKTPIPGGLKGVNINTRYFKDEISTILETLPGDPGAWHENNEFPDGYCEQMVAEYVDEKGQWTCDDGVANHLWDCAVLCMAAHDILGVQFWAAPEAASAAPSLPRAPSRRVRSAGVNV